MEGYKTNKQILADANELARQFYASFGYQVPVGYRFDQATHPQERGMWNMVVIAYEHIDGTPLDDVLQDLDD